MLAVLLLTPLKKLYGDYEPKYQDTTLTAGFHTSYVVAGMVDTPKPLPKVAAHACNCVLWAQANGLDVSGYGAAKNYPVNSQTPAAQGFVVTYEGSLGHIAKYVLSGQYLILTEANFVSCAITTGRIIPVNYSLIKGYIND